MLTIVIPVLAVLVVIVIGALLGRFAPGGFDRFTTLPFWALVAPGLLAAVAAALFLGIMGTDSPNLQNPALTMALVAGGTFVLIATVALLLGAFVTLPRIACWILLGLTAVSAVQFVASDFFKALLGSSTEQ